MAQGSITARDRRRFSLANAWARGAFNAKEQTISVTDLLCEGPVQGLSNAENSVFLDGDPIYDAANESSFFNDKLTISGSVGTGVTTTLSDPTAINHIDETDDEHKRFLFVFDYVDISAKIITIVAPNPQQSQSGYIDIEATSGTPFKQIYKDGQAIAKGAFNFRVYDSKGIFFTDFYISTILNNGTITTSADGNQARLRARATYAMYALSFFNQDDVSNGTILSLKGDLALSAVIETASGNRYIKVDNDYAGATSFSNKQFGLSAVADSSGEEGSTKDSNVQFRRGTENQEPLLQLAGTGTSSISVNLADTDKSLFIVDGNHWRSSTDFDQGSTVYWREEFNSIGASPTAYTENFKDDHDAGAQDNNKGNVSSSRITLQTKSITFTNQGMSESQVSEIDEIRVQLRFPSGLFHMGQNGNQYGHAVAHQMHVWFKRDGEWMLDKGMVHVENNMVVESYSGTKTAFSRDYKVFTEKYQPYEDICLQVTRLTPTATDNPNSDSEYETSVTGPPGPTPYPSRVKLKKHNGKADDNNPTAADASAIASVVAIIKEKLNYPFTALAAITFSSRDYSANPVRTYDVLGKKIKLPSNYKTREEDLTNGIAQYQGLWDGTFQSVLKYSDNPAWVFYDMLSNDRYGLGGFLDEIDIDKFALYKIAKYCDELVPDGKGGTEPRFRANIYLTKATDCYKVLKDMSTVFRGMLYWLDGQMLTVQDSPSAPVYNFGPANIINGDIKSESTGSKTRANQIIVTWNNPNSQFRLEPIIVEDRENILETGKIIKTEAQAFGCTSEGQALRYGKWKLWTSTKQKEVISFETSLTAAFLTPGDVINVQQPDLYGMQFSGRVSAHTVVDTNTNSQLTLDRDVSVESGGVQVDGGGTEVSSYTFSSSSTYTIAALVNVRKVILSQDTAIISGTTYNRGDEIQTAFLPASSSPYDYASTTIDTTETDDNVRKQIAIARDAQNGNDLLLQLVNTTAIETLPFTSSNVSVVAGKTVIKCTGKFSGDLVTSDSIWAIKEQKDDKTQAYSYKEYQILGITEEDTGNIGITAVEFYNSKFDAVDREFELDTPESIYILEKDTCPAPPAVYVLRASTERTLKEEVIVQWEAPLNDDGTVYEPVTGFEIQTNPNAPVLPVGNPSTFQFAMSGLEDGVYKVGVRAVTSDRRSKFTYTTFEVQDPYGSYSGFRVFGVPRGAESNTDKHVVDGTTFKIMKDAWKLRSLGAIEEDPLTNPSPTTASTFTQDMVAMTYTNSDFPAVLLAYILFDHTPDTTNDYLRLIGSTQVEFKNSVVENIIYDINDFAPNNSGGVENNRWTHVNSNVSVATGRYSNKVIRTGGDGFTSGFQLGDIIRLKVGSDFYGAKVAAIISDDILYTESKLNDTSASFAVTANSTNKTVARQAFRPDYIKDSVIATVKRSGNTYNVQNDLRINVAFTGRAATAYLQPDMLNYAADGTLSTSYSNIQLYADAIGYDSPIFKVTGDFATNANPNNSTEAGKADSSFKDATSGNKYTKVVHNTNAAVAYGSGTAQVFTVAVREKQQDDTTWETTTVVSIPKVKQGEQGTDGDSGTRTVQGYLYYEKQTTPGTPPSAPGEATYTFSSGDINGGSGATEVLGLSDSSAVDKWTNEPRTQDPTSSNIHYTVRYFGESLATASTVEVTYSNIVRYTNFSGVVTFDTGTGLLQDGGSDITTIDGSSITTGILRSVGTTLTENSNNPIGTAFATGSGGTGYAYFNLSTGAIATKNFKVDSSGNAEFQGKIIASSGYIGPASATGWNIQGYHINGGGTHFSANTSAGETYANITLDSHFQRILIRDNSQNNRVILGWLGSSVPS